MYTTHILNNTNCIVHKSNSRLSGDEDISHILDSPVSASMISWEESGYVRFSLEDINRTTLGFPYVTSSAYPRFSNRYVGPNDTGVTPELVALAPQLKYLLDQTVGTPSRHVEQLSSDSALSGTIKYTKEWKTSNQGALLPPNPDNFQFAPLIITPISGTKSVLIPVGRHVLNLFLGNSSTCRISPSYNIPMFYFSYNHLGCHELHFKNLHYNSSQRSMYALVDIKVILTMLWENRITITSVARKYLFPDLFPNNDAELNACITRLYAPA